MKEIRTETITTSFLAGMMIGIGDIALLSVENSAIGAFLFSTALLSIIALQLPLYTGRIGKVIKNGTYVYCLVILLCNIAGCCASLWFFMLMREDGKTLVLQTADRKAQMGFLQLFIAGVLCNILIHIAVTAKREVITVLCVMAFILCGFRHSIADAGYAVLGHHLLPWLFVLLGNTAGGLLCEYLLFPQRSGQKA